MKILNFQNLIVQTCSSFLYVHYTLGSVLIPLTVACISNYFSKYVRTGNGKVEVKRFPPERGHTHSNT